MAHGDGRTALVVLVQEAQALYEAWRHRWDPAPGIPAHVTLLFPFRPAAEIDDALLDELRALFAEVPAFEVEFRRVGRFEEVAYLAPEPATPFVELTRRLVAYYGYRPYGGDVDELVPHLTIVNRALPELLDEVERALAPELPLHAEIREAALIEEEADGVWRTRAAFPLAGRAAGIL
jgi:2'-5' RNA ligase